MLSLQLASQNVVLYIMYIHFVQDCFYKINTFVDYFHALCFQIIGKSRATCHHCHHYLGIFYFVNYVSTIGVWA